MELDVQCWMTALKCGSLQPIKTGDAGWNTKVAPDLCISKNRGIIMNALMQKNQNIQHADSDLLQLVIFQLGGEEFGVDIMAVQEIIKMPEITAIPQAPEHVTGVINLRGRVIVVIDLGKKFNILSSENKEEYKVIVVELGDQVIGMMVDSVSEVLRIPSTNVDPAPEIISSGVSANYIQGVGKLDDRLLILLDLRNVLSEHETKELYQYV